MAMGRSNWPTVLAGVGVLLLAAGLALLALTLLIRLIPVLLVAGLAALVVGFLARRTRPPGGW